MACVGKCLRCVRIAKSWHNSTLDQLVKDCKKADFKKNWAEASANLKLIESNQKPSFENDAMVRKGQESTFEMSASYWFITLKEFVERYKFPPKDIGLKVLKYRDEFHSHMLEGSFVKPSRDDPQFLYRAAKISSRQFWEVVEDVMKPEDRLMDIEPMKTFEAISNEHQAGRFKDTCAVPPTGCLISP